MKSFIEILKEFGFHKNKEKDFHVSDPNYKKIDPSHQAVHPGPSHLAHLGKKGVNPQTGERNLPEDTEVILRNELKDFFNFDEEDTE
jgi:hypothetical protein